MTEQNSDMKNLLTNHQGNSKGVTAGEVKKQEECQAWNRKYKTRDVRIPETRTERDHQRTGGDKATAEMMT